MEENMELLNDIYQNSRTGEESIKALLPSVDDAKLKNDLQTQMIGYTQMYAKAQQEIVNRKEQPKENGVLEQVSVRTGVKMNTLLDRTPSHIAEMMIQGSNMGIVSLTKQMKRHPEADHKVKQLADELLKFEENNIQRLKAYL